MNLLGYSSAREKQAAVKAGKVVGDEGGDCLPVFDDLCDPHCGWTAYCAYWYCWICGAFQRNELQLRK